MVITAVILLVTAKYPPQLFALIIGFNRWIYRVIAYAALMTDQYPPFRLDQGGIRTHPAAAATDRRAGHPAAAGDDPILIVTGDWCPPCDDGRQARDRGPESQQALR